MSAPLDRTSSESLWAQLEADLRRRLEAGDFDHRFPTDLALTEAYGVSRHTVREAVGHLQRDGLLKRQRGRGSVIERIEFDQRLGTLYSLFAEIESQGVVQRSEVLSMSEVVDDGVASQLEVDAGTALLRLERLRFAGDEPLAVDRAWLPAELAAPLVDADFTHTALYDELAARCNCRPDRGWERITPVIPTDEEVSLLQIDNGAAAFRVELLGLHDGVAIEWRVTIIRGDRYRFFADWSSASPASLRLGPSG